MKPHSTIKTLISFNFGLLLLISLSCKKDTSKAPSPPAKDEEVPRMINIDLSERSLSKGGSLSIDLNGDGKWELMFNTSNYAQDNNTKSRCEFRVYSSPSTFLSIDTIAEATRALHAGERITLSDMPKHAWLNYNSVSLLQEVSGHSSTYWVGPWVNADHLYFPFRLRKANKVHLGWVEISNDTLAKQLIFHRAAFSEIADKGIDAGRM